MIEDQSQAFGLSLYAWKIVIIEPTHKEQTANIQTRNVLLHIGQNDIQMNVGQNYIKGAYLWQKRSIAQKHVDI